MPPKPPKLPKSFRRKQETPKGLFAALRRHFFTGVALAAPIVITIWLIATIINLFDYWFSAIVPAAYNPQNALPFAVPGLGLLAGVASLTLLGVLARNFFGRRLIQLSEFFVERMPVISSVYSALREVFHMLLSSDSRAMSGIGLIEYPRKGLYAVAFITAQSKGEVAKRVSGDDMIGVFVPTTPNPTSGFFFYVPRKDIIPMDMSVEEAAKLIVSAGLVEPEYEP